MGSHVTPGTNLIFHDSDLILGLWDRDPVSPGHARLISHLKFNV